MRSASRIVKKSSLLLMVLHKNFVTVHLFRPNESKSKKWMRALGTSWKQFHFSHLKYEFGKFVSYQEGNTFIT